jgi:di/tricarboxylate transporter
MTPAQLFVIAVLVIPLTLVFLNRLREDVAALLMASALGIAQYLGLPVLGSTAEDASAALSGFGTPEVITLMSLFIITYSLDKYGLTRWLAGRLLAIGGNSERRLIGLFAGSTAVLSLFMNTLAAGALMLPSALDASRRTAIKPSKLLIPIAYGAMLGGAATYLTTANIIISGLLPLASPPQEPLRIFDFTPTGGVVAIAGLAFLTFFGKSLLPEREAPAMQVNPQTRELTNIFHLEERLWEAEIQPNSHLIGEPLKEAVEKDFGLTVLSIRRDERVIPAYRPTYRLQGGDVLIIVGHEARLMQLSKEKGIPIRAYNQDIPTPPDTILVEAIVPPRSAAEAKTLRDITFRARYGFTAVALWRDNMSIRTNVSTQALQPGDSLLLVGPQERLMDLRQQNDFIIMRAVDDNQKPDFRRAGLTGLIGIAALIATFLGMPVELAMVAGASVMLLIGLLKPEEAYAAIKWRAIFLIAGTIALSVAMIHTGLAGLIGDAVVNVAGPFGKMGLVIGAYVLSAMLTQVMGGQISPLVVGPIVISAAIRLGVNPQAIAVVTAIAGSVSFITPLSHPVNILMIAPGNITFQDFVRTGIPLTIVCFIALMIATPLFWPL